MSRGERLLGPKRNTGRGKRESTEEKETRQGKRSELNLKLNLREMRDGRGYLQKTTDMSLPLVNHVSSGFTVCSPRRREVYFHAMIDKLDAFLCYCLLLLLSFSHRTLSSRPNFSVVFLFIQRLHAKRLGGMGVNMEATFQ